MTKNNSSAPPGRPFRAPLVLGLVVAGVFAAGAAAQAGILRDMFAKVGIAPKQPVTANGDTPVFPRQGFLCCNLHRDGDTIVDSNYATLPDVVKAGTPVTVIG